MEDMSRRDLVAVGAAAAVAASSAIVGRAGMAEAEVGGQPHFICSESPEPVGPASDPGTSGKLSRCDHTHEGVHKVASANGSIIVRPPSGLGDVDLSVSAPPFRVVSTGSAFVRSNSSPVLATFQRSPGERVIPLVWASEKSDVFTLGFQGTLAPPGDRTLNIFLEKTTTPDEMSLRCANEEEDVEVEWAVIAVRA